MFWDKLILTYNLTVIQRLSSFRSKIVVIVLQEPQNLSFIERSNVLCFLSRGSFKRGSTRDSYIPIKQI